MRYVSVSEEELDDIKRDVHELMRLHLNQQKNSKIITWTMLLTISLAFLYAFSISEGFLSKNVRSRAKAQSKNESPSLISGSLMPGKSVFIPVITESQNSQKSISGNLP